MISLASRGLRKLREARHDRLARAVIETPPARAWDDGVIIFSMIGTRVLLPYLVAAKSLHARLGRGRFAILDDGTVTASDRAVLAEHLDRPEILPIDRVDTGSCPRGGCWERLLTLLELRRDAYVVQLDSDTVTLGPLDEVAAAIDTGRGFTLFGGSDAQLLPAADYSADRATLGRAHVQRVAEAALDRLEGGLPSPRYYVRGCAGFAGFAPGGLDREVAETCSRELAGLVGAARWAEWGSEQVMSNLLVANERDPVLLPYDRYLNYWGEPLPPGANFVHFVGTYRHHGGAYAAATRRALAELGAPAQPRTSANASPSRSRANTASQPA